MAALNQLLEATAVKLGVHRSFIEPHIRTRHDINDRVSPRLLCARHDQRAGALWKIFYSNASS